MSIFTENESNKEYAMKWVKSEINFDNFVNETNQVIRGSDFELCDNTKTFFIGTLVSGSYGHYQDLAIMQ